MLAVAIMCLAAALQGYCFQAYIGWACNAGYADPGLTWRDAAVSSVVFMAPGAVTAFLTAIALDAWYLPALIRGGWATPTQSNTIQLPTWQVAAQNVAAILMVCLWPHAAGVWWLQYVPAKLYFSPIRALTVLLGVLIIHDAYYYAVHRLLHHNRWLYRAVHADHHRRELLLQARTGLFISAAEAVVLVGLPYGAMAMTIPLLMPSVSHYEMMLSIFTSSHIAIIGHSGVKFNNPLALLAINPFLAAILLTGTAQSPHDHQVGSHLSGDAEVPRSSYYPADIHPNVPTASAVMYTCLVLPGGPLR
jgi:sterol desaturase/sphingolipid hydroxylase (fatty acid hydroxylase superfamily)